MNIEDMSNSRLWHNHLAHISQTRGLWGLLALGYISNLQYLEFDFYEFYQYGKQTPNPHSIRYEMVHAALELVQTNMCGPML